MVNNYPYGDRCRVWSVSLDFAHDKGISSWLPRDSRHVLDMRPIPAAGKVIDIESSPP